MHMTPRLQLRNVAKSFTMHLRGGVRLPVVADLSFSVAPGECVVLGGPSAPARARS
jgi:alpha-D-ribose 1-methylphosphonate 5-triphosphate synthase subunit PhnL